jgi:hypothetical protein
MGWLVLDNWAPDRKRSRIWSSVSEERDDCWRLSSIKLPWTMITYRLSLFARGVWHRRCFVLCCKPDRKMAAFKKAVVKCFRFVSLSVSYVIPRPKISFSYMQSWYEIAEEPNTTLHDENGNEINFEMMMMRYKTEVDIWEWFAIQITPLVCTLDVTQLKNQRAQSKSWTVDLNIKCDIAPPPKDWKSKPAEARSNRWGWEKRTQTQPEAFIEVPDRRRTIV